VTVGHRKSQGDQSQFQALSCWSPLSLGTLAADTCLHLSHRRRRHGGLGQARLFLAVDSVGK
jgi:hypothetical protein